MSLLYLSRKRGVTALRHFGRGHNMATTSGNPIEFESDGAHVTFVQHCDLGTFGESKWMSASVARDLIARGIAVESDPAPKQ